MRSEPAVHLVCGEHVFNIIDTRSDSSEGNGGKEGVGNGEDGCVVVVGGGELREAVEIIFVQHLCGVGPGVVDVYLGAVLPEFVDDVDHSGVADVGAVLFEGDAEDEHFCPFDFVVAGNHEFHHFGGDVLPHVVVEATACQDDFGVVKVGINLLSRFGGEAGGDFFDFGDSVLLVAGVDAFGRITSKEIFVEGGA